MVKTCGRSRKVSRRHHPAATRQAVEHSVLVEGMTIWAAARSHGVPPSTARSWTTLRASTQGRDPDEWSAARRAAAVRVYDNPTVALGDWALLLGWPRAGAARLAARCALPAADVASPARGEPAQERPGWEAAELGRRLRRHLARRIASLDAELASARAGPDTAKALRDLGGLKRLLDELGEAGGSDDRTPQDRPSDGDAGSLDLAALRATVAARIAAFEEGGPA